MTDDQGLDEVFFYDPDEPSGICSGCYRDLVSSEVVQSEQVVVEGHPVLYVWCHDCCGDGWRCYGVLKIGTAL